MHVALDSPQFPLSSSKLYTTDCTEPGQVFWWEQKHFLRHISITNFRNYVKNQNKRGILDRLSVEWKLQGTTWHPGHQLMGKTTLLQTQLLLPWLLHTLKPHKHAFAHQQQREQLASLLETLHAVALTGYQHANITPSIKVMIPGTFCNACALQ